MIRRTLLALFFSLLLAVAAWAQTVTVYVVEYTGEARQELTAEDKEPFMILTDFLNSGKNGKLTVSDDGQASMWMEKTGEDLMLYAPGAEPEKATVKEMLEELNRPEPASSEEEKP